MNHEEALDLLADHEAERATNDGYPPKNREAFLAAARRDWNKNDTDYVLRAASGVQARRAGKKLTGWRWTRGTHSGTYERDPYGTDTPPHGYS